jgi:hypothetical protein
MIYDEKKLGQKSVRVLPVLTVHLATTGHIGTNGSTQSRVNLSYHAVFIGLSTLKVNQQAKA